MFDLKLLVSPLNSSKKGQENICYEKGINETVEGNPSDSGFILKGNPEWNEYSNIDKPRCHNVIPYFFPSWVGVDDAFRRVDLVYRYDIFVTAPFLLW